jgi:polar amino acid transport system permease protein
MATAYVEAIRNTPFLIQLLFIFFGISSLGPALGNEQAALLALTINFGAYATEICRAGIQSIDTGQLEAGCPWG